MDKKQMFVEPLTMKERVDYCQTLRGKSTPCLVMENMEALDAKLLHKCEKIRFDADFVITLTNSELRRRELYLCS